MLEETLRKYHNRLIDATAVVEAMLRIKQEMEKNLQRAQELGLSEEERAFYDAVAQVGHDVYGTGPITVFDGQGRWMSSRMSWLESRHVGLWASGSDSGSFRSLDHWPEPQIKFVENSGKQ